jgi:hypothetical protein
MSISSIIANAAGSLSSFGPKTPGSQKAGDRPITFRLDDFTTGDSNTISLIIRPEELTRTDVSRVTVQQTLGGAWADDFGPGMAQINISGHTGWRGNNDGDGAQHFLDLKAQVFDNWHAQRNAAVQSGKDPHGVVLVFIDALDSNIDVVIPLNFTLRRSKSRPLLMQYNISMMSIFWQAKSPAVPASPGGLAGLLGSIKNLIRGVNNVVNFAKAQIGQITAFMNTATGIFQSVTNLIANVQSVPQSLLGPAVAMAQAGATMFSTIAATAGLSTSQSAAAMSIASDFSNVQCLLGNAVNTQKIYQDYTPLLGASNCSSTNGGSPPSVYADTNPFYAIVGAPQNAPAAVAAAVVATASPIVTVTPAAQQSLAIVNSSDPVLAPLSLAAIGAAAGAIAAGVSVK